METGPVTRLRLLRSSNIASSGVSGGLTSAVALAILKSTGFPLPSAGAASIRISVKAPVPLIDRPGPPSGRFGSLSNSSRTARIGAIVVLTVIFTVCLVGAYPCARKEPSSIRMYFCPPVDSSSTSGRTIIHAGDWVEMCFSHEAIRSRQSGF